MLEENGEANINQTTLINFITTRPVEELTQEYLRCFWELYEPSRYLARVYRHFSQMKPIPHKKKFRMPKLIYIRAFLTICWRQGLKRDTRFQFWRQLFLIIRHNPGVTESYLTNCAHLEHFSDYRQIVRSEIEAQLAKFLAAEANLKTQTREVTAVLN